jgi:hypothetical protein
MAVASLSRIDRKLKRPCLSFSTLPAPQLSLVLKFLRAPEYLAKLLTRQFEDSLLSELRERFEKIFRVHSGLRSCGSYANIRGLRPPDKLGDGHATDNRAASYPLRIRYGLMQVIEMEDVT